MSLRLDIPHDAFLLETYQCLSSSADRGRNLRYLHVRLYSKCFLELLIEHAPNLEQLSVYFEELWTRTDFVNDTFRKSYQICPEKVGHPHDFMMNLSHVSEIVFTKIKMFHS